MGEPPQINRILTREFILNQQRPSLAEQAESAVDGNAMGSVGMAEIRNGVCLDG